jgi:hypothetical protein
MKKSSDSIGNRTRDLLVCSAVPQSLRHRVPPVIAKGMFYYYHCYYLGTTSASGPVSASPLAPSDPYMGRPAQLTSRRCILNTIQQISVMNILNMLHNLRPFLFKTPLIS